jgi:CheY-like chemotaxis protein
MSQTILLVEDNEDNQTIYRVILEYHGYRVLIAGDGERGVAMAREAMPDVILMDVSIPIIDGLEATRILKADPSTATIPIIILTAHAMTEDRENAFAAGGDAFLSKPVEPKRVAAEIRRVLAGEKS